MHTDFGIMNAVSNVNFILKGKEDTIDYIYKDEYYIVGTSGDCYLTKKFREELDSNQWEDIPLPPLPEKATSLQGLFAILSNVISLDLSNYNTENIYDMTAMFYGCSSLKQLEINFLNVSKIKYMSSIFEECSSLSKLDLSKWVLTNLKEFKKAFMNCTKLKELSLPLIKSPDLKVLDRCFKNCSSLVEIDLSDWVVDNIIWANEMFYECISLEKVNLSTWTIPKCRSIVSMFYGCENLKYLDISNLCPGDLVDINYLFYNCRKIKELDLSKWRFTDVGSLDWVFENCTSLEKLNLDYLDVSKVYSFTDTFLNCHNLIEISANGWNLTNKKFIPSDGYVECNIFKGCNVKAIPQWYLDLLYDLDKYYYVTDEGKCIIDDGFLRELNKGLWNNKPLPPLPKGVKSLKGAFNVHNNRFKKEFGNKFTTVDLSNWDISDVEDMSEMFYDCKNLKEVIIRNDTDTLGNWDTSKVKYMSNMFALTSLEEIDVSSWKIDSLKKINGMFFGCLYLNEVIFGDWAVSNIEDATNLFALCENADFDINNWKLSDNCKQEGIFYHCYNKSIPDWYQEK